MDDRLAFYVRCPRHNTVTPIRLGPGPGEYRQAPPAGVVCVDCLRERRDPEPDRTGTETPFKTTRGPLDPDSLPPRLRAVYIRQLAAQKERGFVVAGSDEEEHVLAQMDAARDESVWHDHASVAERRRRAQRQRRRGYVTPAFREMS